MNNIPIESILASIATLSKHPRYPGSLGAEFARKHIIEKLHNLGYPSTLHKTQISHWELLENPTIEVITGEGKIIAGIPLMLSYPTPINGVVGKLVTVEPIDVLDSFEWSRMAVVNEHATELAFLVSSDKDMRVQPLPETAGKTPYVAMTYPDFLELLSAVNAGQDQYVKVTNSTSIIGENELINIVTGPPMRPYVLVCAHYDTTFNSNGALDNASGVSVALHLAESLMENKLSCNFVFFDGEELNKAGSKAYVSSLSEKELSLIRFVVEIDTVGAGRDITFLCSKKLSKTLRNVIYDTNIIKEFNVQVNPQSRIAFSDVWPFMQKGIPVIRMLTRAPKGEGKGHDVIHTADDTIDKIDSETLIAGYSTSLSLIDYLCRYVDASL